jgi:hypothetical protein
VPNSSLTIRGAAVVLDHVGEEEAVELRSARRSSSAICSGVSIPGISITCSAPCIRHLHRRGSGLGHRLAAVAQPALHGGDLVLLRVDDARRQMRMDGLASCVGAQLAITMAWAWWPIMWDMNFTSACGPAPAVGRRGLGMRVGVRLRGARGGAAAGRNGDHGQQRRGDRAGV